MADETIISWNVANWITVVIMVAVMFTIAGMIARIVQQRKGGTTRASS